VRGNGGKRFEPDWQVVVGAVYHRRRFDRYNVSVIRQRLLRRKKRTAPRPMKRTFGNQTNSSG
jgi:hypothetical protein